MKSSRLIQIEPKLKLVNIFAGDNNSGKTVLLEEISEQINPPAFKIEYCTKDLEVDLLNKYFSVNPDDLVGAGFLSIYTTVFSYFNSVSLNYNNTRPQVFLDDIDSHVSIQNIPKLARIMQELIMYYQLPTYITTHSKLFTDCFLDDNSFLNEVSLFRLAKGTSKHKFISGTRYKVLSDLISFDIRETLEEDHKELGDEKNATI